MENACSSALQGIECAFQSIQMGESESCVVACVNLCIDPKVDLGFLKYNMLSPDGSCKSFDIAGTLLYYFYIILFLSYKINKHVFIDFCTLLRPHFPTYILISEGGLKCRPNMCRMCHIEDML